MAILIVVLFTLLLFPALLPVLFFVALLILELTGKASRSSAPTVPTDASGLPEPMGSTKHLAA